MHQTLGEWIAALKQSDLEYAKIMQEEERKKAQELLEALEKQKDASD